MSRPRPLARYRIEVEMKPNAMPSVMLVVSGIMIAVRKAGIAW